MWDRRHFHVKHDDCKTQVTYPGSQGVGSNEHYSFPVAHLLPQAFAVGDDAGVVPHHHQVFVSPDGDIGLATAKHHDEDRTRATQTMCTRRGSRVS